MQSSVQDCFSAVFTNPAKYEASGALRVSPYASMPHGCPRCPSNLCKGQVKCLQFNILTVKCDQVLDAVLKRQQYDRVVYLGDGSGDFCPCTRLHHPDIVCARLHYPNEAETTPLLRKCTQSHAFKIMDSTSIEPGQIRDGQRRTQVYPWKDQVELASLLQRLLKSV